MNHENGVSVIIVTHNSEKELDQLLAAFLQTNTHKPIEIIVVDHSSNNNTAAVIDQYAIKVFIRMIQREGTYPLSSVITGVIQKAVYNNLLFISTDMVYAVDVLPRAVTKLLEAGIDSVGICQDGDSTDMSIDRTSFLLCRKANFLNNPCFCIDAVYNNDGYWHVDIQLEKKPFWITDISLENVSDVTRPKNNIFIRCKSKATVFPGRLVGYSGQSGRNFMYIPGAKGVSIIVLTRDAAPLLDRLLTTFFDVNTYMPVELIIIDHGSTDQTSQVIARHIHHGSINHINRGQNYSFANSCNHGAASARYPYLLFLNNDIIYTSDAISAALVKLEEDLTIGAVGIRLVDVPNDLPPGKMPGVQHDGICFIWNEKRGYHQPEQIRHPDAKISSLPPSSLFPAVTGAFLLCRKTDFQALKGFSEDYDYGLEDIDICLRMGRELKKTCWCMNDMSLQHVDGATRRLGDKTERAERIEANHRFFKKRWGGYIRELLDGRPAGNMAERLPAVSHPAVVRYERNSRPTLCILFVLPQPIDSNCGYHVERLAAGLQAQGAECMAAVPQNANTSLVTRHSSLVTRSYAEIQKNGILFSNGHGPDIIHAWTPREGARQFVASLIAKTPCPVVIHLEDNEEYLTETAVGQPFAELEKLAQKELDKIIPNNRYHPVHGRIFLEQAQGLTMIIDTLEKFNFAHIPSLNILPPVDERFFYPRPINHALRNKLGIPKNHIVLVYCGNVHAGNREEVLTLYQAVQLLNQQRYPTTLIRTGINAVPLTDGDEAWIENFEIHLGWVSREELPDIMAAADMFVQPGKPGPFNDYRIPCKLPEYFAMGRPVILPKTNLGLMVGHSKEGYVLDKADVEAIANAVQEIWGDKALSDRLAYSSVDFYLDKLISWNLGDILTTYHRTIISNPKSRHVSVPRKETGEKPANRLTASPFCNEKNGKTCHKNHADFTNNLIHIGSPFQDNGYWDETVSSLQSELGPNIKVVSCLERDLREGHIPQNNSWIGFVHAFPVMVPDWLSNLPPYSHLINDKLFKLKNWDQAKDRCKGLFVFSRDHAERLMPIAGVPVHVVQKPLPEIDGKWCSQAFEADNDKTIIQVGWWLQRGHAIFVLPSNDQKKLWIKQSHPNADAIMQAEYKHLTDRYVYFDSMSETVTAMNHVNKAEYQDLMIKSLAFAHYHDGNTIDFVLECIARETPVLVNPYASIREYLGDNYPLYYYFYKDAADKAANFGLLLKAHEHLKQLSGKMQRSPYSLTHVIRQILKSDQP